MRTPCRGTDKLEAEDNDDDDTLAREIEEDRDEPALPPVFPLSEATGTKALGHGSEYQELPRTCTL